jgi:zinc transporter 1/2/3
MEVIAIQVICLLVLFVIMTFCGLLPVMLVMRNKNVHFSDLTSTLISMCNCLAGGVFIGMCFLGLFPYVHEKFDSILIDLNVSTTFPIAEFVVIMGFFLILTIEQSILMKQSINDRKSNAMSDAVLAHVETTSVKKLEDEESYVCLLDSESQDMESSGGSDHKSSVNAHSMGKTDLFNEIKMTSQPSVPRPITQDQRQMSNKISPKTGHSHSHINLVGERGSGLKYLILLIAVSIHSLFEGITLGLQTDKVKILHLFLAVLIHETLVAFALGVNIAKLNAGFLKSFKYVLTVTISIPVGILLGLLIGAAPGIFGDIISGLFQGIAAGIFIHVTFMELLPDEFLANGNKLLKVLFFFIGFLIMAVVNFALGDHK